MRTDANTANKEASPKELVYPELSYQLIGILFQAHKELGRYCNEKQYGDRVEVLLQEKKISYQREYVLPVSFAGEHPARNKVDFVVENKIVLELKTKPMITREDYYQTQRYLRALERKLGILVNFRKKYIAPKRILNSEVEIY